MLASCMHLAFVCKLWLINRFACRSRRIGCTWSRGVTWGHVGSQRALYWLQLRMVMWGAGAPRIGRCTGWSRGQWQAEWHVVDDIIDLHTACWYYVILVDESIVGRFRCFKGHRSRSRRRGGRLWCSLLHCGHISVVYGRLKKTSRRICMFIVLISTHPFSWNITPWEERMTSGDVFFSQSERFNSVERTITSLFVVLEVGWEGRVGWQRLEWLGLKHTVWVLNCMHLSFTKSKAK